MKRRLAAHLVAAVGCRLLQINSFSVHLTTRRISNHVRPRYSSTYLDDEVIDDELFEGEDLLSWSTTDDETDGEQIPIYDGLSIVNLTEAFDPNVSYFYLKNELGLSDEAMWKVTYEAGSALGMTAATIRTKVECLRQSLDLSDADIRVIIERQPTILHLSAEKNIAPTIHFLMQLLDSGEADMRNIILDFPSVICYTTKNLKSKVAFFTDHLGLSTAETRSLFLAEPNLLRASVRTGLVPHMRFLRRDLDISAPALRQIVQKHPRILLYSLDDNLIPKLIFYCISTLHMTTDQVQKMLLQYPDAILKYNLDRHILPITSYFLKDLDMSAIEFRGILLKFPRIMTHSLVKIKHVLGYLRYEIGLSGHATKRILYQAPQVIGLSRTNLVSKVQYLQDSLGLAPEELLHVLAGMPTLLKLSIDSNLRPKVVYLGQSFGGDDSLLREAVLKLPTLLGYSLDKRIRPRMEALLRAGVAPMSITVAIPMNESNFVAWLARKAAKGRPEPSAIVPYYHLASKDKGERITHWTRPRRLVAEGE